MTYVRAACVHCMLTGIRHGDHVFAVRRWVLLVRDLLVSGHEHQDIFQILTLNVHLVAHGY